MNIQTAHTKLLCYKDGAQVTSMHSPSPSQRLCTDAIALAQAFSQALSGGDLHQLL